MICHFCTFHSLFSCGIAELFFRYIHIYIYIIFLHSEMSFTSSKIIVPAAVRAVHSGYVLSNGVKCIIVQDSNAKMPAAAMSIHAGQLNDPVELPGLAHFCEHMLFMGTEKFPKEDEFNSFVEKRNGLTNAFTADCATTYYFMVSNDGFEGALERFVEFFASPNFSPGAVSREVNAVHSEDEKNHNHDFWRLDEVMRSLYNPAHPRSRYGNGNATTLLDEPKEKGIDVREALKVFHSRNYLAEAAAIAVVSTRPPEEVLQFIEAPLSRMQRGPTSRFSFLPEGESLLSQAALGSWINLRSVRKMRELSLRWPVPCSSDTWRGMPSAYISHVLGHECDTSVLGVLKKRDWATGAVAGSQRIDDDFELFNMSFSLTLAGFQHIAEVIDLLYQGIGQAIAGGVNEAVYQQMKAEEMLNFEASDVGNPSDHCVGLAMSANETDVEHCWIGGEVVLEDDLDASLQYVRHLTPENCVAVLRWGDLPCPTAEATKSDGCGSDEPTAEEDEEDEASVAEEGEAGVTTVTPQELLSSLPLFAQMPIDKTSRFHRAMYGVAKVPKEYLSRWNTATKGPYIPELALPALNPYLASDFTIAPATGEQPVAEKLESEHGVTYVRRDTGHHSTFKAAVRCNLISPVVYASPLNRLYARVMRSILSNALTEVAYYATLASLSNSVLFDSTGLGYVVEGPSQKLPEFFTTVVSKGFDREVLRGTAEEYTTYMEAAVRHLKGVAMGQPYDLALQVRQQICSVTNFLFDEILGTVPTASYEGYCSFVDEYLREGMLLECFVAGNIISVDDVRDTLVGPLEALLASHRVIVAPKEGIPRVRDSYALSMKVPQSTTDVVTKMSVVSRRPYNPADPNVAVVVDLYIGRSTPRLKALTTVAMKLVSSSFFNVLRTRESLGYIVGSQAAESNGAIHVIFFVQSALPDVDGVYLISRIVAFLSGLEISLETICTEEEVQSVRNSLIVSLEKLPDTVSADASQLFGEYLSADGFETRKRIIDALRQLTLAEVLSFFHDYILNGRSRTEALAVCLNNTRSATTDPFLKPGLHTIALPPKRQMDVVEGGESTEETNDITIEAPTFATGQAYVVMQSFSSIRDYQAGQQIIRSSSY